MPHGVLVEEMTPRGPRICYGPVGVPDPSDNSGRARPVMTDNPVWQWCEGQYDRENERTAGTMEGSRLGGQVQNQRGGEQEFTERHLELAQQYMRSHPGCDWPDARAHAMQQYSGPQRGPVLGVDPARGFGHPAENPYDTGLPEKLPQGKPWIQPLDIGREEAFITEDDLRYANEYMARKPGCSWEEAKDYALTKRPAGSDEFYRLAMAYQSSNPFASWKACRDHAHKQLGTKGPHGYNNPTSHRS